MIKHTAFAWMTSLSLTALALFAGCSDDASPTPAASAATPDGGSSTGDKDAASTGDSATPSSGTTKHITAAEGGTITDASGKVSLAIPPGALAQDTDISLDIGPAEAGSASGVFEFGPTGTQFSKPAVLSAKVDGQVPKGKVAKLAVLEGDTWKSLDGAAFADGTATGNVAHFSKFAILFEGVPSSGGSCAEKTKDWKGCGGDPKGTWKYGDACMTTTEQNPLAKPCPASTLETQVTVDGTITFDGTNATTSAKKTTTTHTLIVPTSCYGALDNATCDSLKTTLKADSCTEADGKCTCKKTETEAKDGEATRPYSVEGTKITIGTDAPIEFCVNGATASFESIDDETKARDGIIFLDKQ